MATAQRGYYDILGIQRDASRRHQESLSQAGPVKSIPTSIPAQKNGNGEKFKEIERRHEALSDPDKEKKYDQYGQNWEQAEAYEKADSSRRCRTRRPSRWIQRRFRGHL